MDTITAPIWNNSVVRPPDDIGVVPRGKFVMLDSVESTAFRHVILIWPPPSSMPKATEIYMRLFRIKGTQ